MREECKPWVLDVLAHHDNNLFSTLIYSEHIISDNMKTIEFEPGHDSDGEKSRMIYDKAFKGFFARKNKHKFWLDAQYETEEGIVKIKDMLPIKYYPEELVEMIDGKDIVSYIPEPTPFKIVPKYTMTPRTLIDSIFPFEHSHPIEYRVYKSMALMGNIGKTFICLATESSFGKSTFYEAIDHLTSKTPVFKPRSVPGVLNKINSTGNMVFDEAQDCKSDVKNIMEEFSLDIAGGKTTYINGALKAANTKERYDCSRQSITFLFNIVSNYKDPEKQYFDFMFKNNVAIDDRFLKICFPKGVLLEKFDKDFDIVSVAENNMLKYIEIAKNIEFLTLKRRQNDYTRRYKTNTILNIKGRRKQTYDDITWFLDLICKDQEEYDQHIEVLDNGILNYKKMVNDILENTVKVECHDSKDTQCSISETVE